VDIRKQNYYLLPDAKEGDVLLLRQVKVFQPCSMCHRLLISCKRNPDPRFAQIVAEHDNSKYAVYSDGSWRTFGISQQTQFIPLRSPPTQGADFSPFYEPDQNETIVASLLQTSLRASMPFPVIRNPRDEMPQSVQGTFLSGSRQKHLPSFPRVSYSELSFQPAKEAVHPGPSCSKSELFLDTCLILLQVPNPP
jgi:hypothetical protein